jgi:hypothetical protein
MPRATAEEIREGISSLITRPDFTQKYKNIEGGKIFNKLLVDLKVWLEVNDCGELNEDREDDKKLVAGVISESFHLKFVFGNSNKIGGYARGTLARVAEVLATAQPVFTNLQTSWAANKGKYSVVRRDVVRVLGINDKGHDYHGSNFSGQQTLRQIIANLLDGVKVQEEQARIRGVISQKYHFQV